MLSLIKSNFPSVLSSFLLSVMPMAKFKDLRYKEPDIILNTQQVVKTGCAGLSLSCLSCLNDLPLTYKVKLKSLQLYTRLSIIWFCLAPPFHVLPPTYTLSSYTCRSNSLCKFRLLCFLAHTVPST